MTLYYHQHAQLAMTYNSIITAVTVYPDTFCLHALEWSKNIIVPGLKIDIRFEELYL